MRIIFLARFANALRSLREPVFNKGFSPSREVSQSAPTIFASKRI
jgi:hypothetical protein